MLPEPDIDAPAPSDHANLIGVNVNRWTLSLIVAAALGVGVVIGLLAASRGNAYWIGVAGTWVGSVGTIVAILWGFNVFRVEQQQAREAEAQKGRAKLQAAQEQERAELQRQADEAAALTFQTVTAGGYGRGTAEATVIAVYFEVVNTTDELVPARIWLEGHEDRAIVRRLKPKEADVIRFDVELSVPYDDLTRQPVTVVRSFMEYTVNGRTWRRQSGGEPERV